VSAVRPETKPPTTGPRFLAALKKLAPHKRYALAVSGGRDSMALVALAAAAVKKSGAPRFHVVSVDHGLRKQARQELRLVADTCRRVGLPHKILRADVPLGKTGIQQAARDLRYRLMAGWCAAQKIPALVVAHHQRDQAETLLMRLARGSGVDGLSGMAAVQKLETTEGGLQILRPFLETDPALLADLVRRAKFDWIEDPSNHDTQFERVRWRQAATLLEELGLNAPALARTSANMRQMRDYLDAQMTDWLQAHGGYHFCGFYCLDRRAFSRLPTLMRLRVLRAVMACMGPVKFAPPEPSISHADGLIAARAHGGHTLGGCMIRWRADEIMIGRELAAVNAARPVPLTRQTMVWDRRFSVRIRPGKKPKTGLFAAPLGTEGLRLLERTGLLVPKRVPRCYLHVLPAIFDARGLLSCPVLDADSAYTVVPWQPDTPNLPDIGVMAGW
jgi:tRNA(Ile)-lysidine synthase